MNINSRKASSTVNAVIFAAFLIFVLFPLFAVGVEKYLLLIKSQMIRDAVDITNIAVYTAVTANSLGKACVDFDTDKARDLYSELLAENLKIADGAVIIETLEFITLERPSVHARVIVPVKPSLYAGLIQHIQLRADVVSEIPLNR
jgi:hypothetical protein